MVGRGEDGAEGLGELALEHRQVLAVVLLCVNDLRVRGGVGRGLGCGCFADCFACLKTVLIARVNNIWSLAVCSVTSCTMWMRFLRFSGIFFMSTLRVAPCRRTRVCELAAACTITAMSEWIPLRRRLGRQGNEAEERRSPGGAVVNGAQTKRNQKQFLDWFAKKRQTKPD